jgi:hypothetical protein
MLSAAFGNHGSDDRHHWLAGAEGFIRRAGKKARALNYRRSAEAQGGAGR